MKNKKGISLIVLVITIIIIIILAGAVILNLADNNPIENASESKIVSDLDAFESDLTIQIGQKYLENTMLKTEDIDSSVDKESEWYITKLIPSIEGTEYEKYLAVENGKLKLRIDNELNESTKEIIENNLGKAVITASMITENPEEYIGKSVKYTGYSENTNTIDWRLFGLDQNGNIMLKANDYVNLKNKSVDFYVKIDEYRIYLNDNKDDSSNDKDNSSNNIDKSRVREPFINYLGTPSNWSEYAVYGKTEARGAMTLLEFVKGYNLVNNEKLEIEYLTKDASSSDGAIISASANGYIIKKGTAGTYNYFISGITEEYNGMKLYNTDTSNNAWYMRLSDVSANNYYKVMGVAYDGRIGDYGAGSDSLGGICPVVSLTIANLVQDEKGNLVVE